nr:phage Gp37/Gp68 family protein [Luteolibacter pohnpeiensis]
MGSSTNIAWCDMTFNPWTGCTKVSPGCANCYAEGWSKRSGIVKWGMGQPRRRTSEANWKLPLKWNREGHLNYEKRNGYRPKVFCASLADWLDHEVPHGWRVDLLNLIAETPYLDWLLLTKRPESWSARLHECAYASPLAAEWINGNPPPNVWVGTTVEDQARADERIPLLLEIPAKVRFLSCEPLLGPVTLPYIDFPQAWEIAKSAPSAQHDPLCSYRKSGGGILCDCDVLTKRSGMDGIHWVICGGESGPGARPMHPDWARLLQQQCEEQGVSFLFKQWGEWCPATEGFGVTGNVMPDTGEKFRWIGWDGKTKNPSFHGLVPPVMAIAKQGKQRAGRLLDGREWNEFPKAGGEK